MYGFEDTEDPVKTRSAYAEYDGNKKWQNLEIRVVFQMIHHTLYWIPRLWSLGNIAYYYNSGKVVDSVNVLTKWKSGTSEFWNESLFMMRSLGQSDYTMKD